MLSIPSREFHPLSESLIHPASLISYPLGRPTAPAQTMILAGQAAWASAEPAALPSHMGKELYLGKLDAVDKQIIRSIAALASVIAIAYCHRYNRPFTNPKPAGSFIENVMLMMGMVDATTGRPDSKRAKCLEKLWILYADHEMINSTAAFPPRGIFTLRPFHLRHRLRRSCLWAFAWRCDQHRISNDSICR